MANGYEPSLAAQDPGRLAYGLALSLVLRARGGRTCSRPAPVSRTPSSACRAHPPRGSYPYAEPEGHGRASGVECTCTEHRGGCPGQARQAARLRGRGEGAVLGTQIEIERSLTPLRHPGSMFDDPA